MCARDPRHCIHLRAICVTAARTLLMICARWKRKYVPFNIEHITDRHGTLCIIQYLRICCMRKEGERSKSDSTSRHVRQASARARALLQTLTRSPRKTNFHKHRTNKYLIYMQTNAKASSIDTRTHACRHVRTHAKEPPLRKLNRSTQPALRPPPPHNCQSKTRHRI